MRAEILTTIKSAVCCRPMRVLIKEPLSGTIDGINLNSFEAGSVYDVSNSLASYLFAMNFAERVTDTSPALLVPIAQAVQKRKE